MGCLCSSEEAKKDVSDEVKEGHEDYGRSSYYALVELRTHEDLDHFLKESGDQLVVLEFYATWCNPCRMLGPKLEEMRKEYKDVRFAKIDVDISEAIAGEYGIVAMPTICFVKKGVQVDSVTGLDESKVRQILKKFTGQS